MRWSALGATRPRARADRWTLVFTTVLVTSFGLPLATAGSAAGGPPSGDISAELVPPNTFYVALVSDPDGDNLTYDWSADIECGTFNGNDPSDDGARWSHGSTECPHPGTDHPGTIRVEVADGTGFVILCTYEGSGSGAGPPCETTQAPPSPTPSETVPTESPEPTPSESVPTASPSPSPTGPLLVLTKTVEPKKLPEAQEFALAGAMTTWTVKVRNVGSAAYEGPLTIDDWLPDIWNLVPETATADGPTGFIDFGTFWRLGDELSVRAGPAKGTPGELLAGAVGIAQSCTLTFGAGGTLEPREDGTIEQQRGTTTIDDWNGFSLSQILRSRKAEKLKGSAHIICEAQGRIEPGQEVVITIEARRPLKDRFADVKTNLAEARWDGGEALAKASVELEGFNSVIDDIEPIVPLGRASARAMGAGPGAGLYGTEAVDELTGTSRSDVLMGHYGDDVLRGLRGIDVISGDVGNDAIYGGGGGDGLIGGSGKDTISGGDGNDVLVGGPDKDRLLGGAGDDHIYARDGERDVVKCGPGRDTAIVDDEDRVKGCERIRRK